MAVIRDVMPAFELFQPTSIDGTLALLAQHSSAWVLAGGLDSFDWFKDRLRRPGAVIDLSGVQELRGIRAWNGGLEIGAMTTLTEVVRSPEVKQRFSILLAGAEAAASPQIRNQGTIGGNVSQDTRCCYYRSGWTCYRAGGNICYADTPTAINREHAILEMDRCVAVNPSDTAPALIALGAQMVIRSSEGERVVNAEDYFVGPAVNITRMTVLRPSELLIAIRIPGDFAGAQFFFEKVRDRQVWDFALVSVSSAMTVVNGRIDRIRVAANGVAARPLRLSAVEEAVKGRARDEQTAELAGSLAVRGARTLQHNAYKVPMLKNLIKRAIRGQETEQWTSSHPA
jgi:xanthine dehydrogenase YagS FAD-binding subunit